MSYENQEDLNFKEENAPAAQAEEFQAEPTPKTDPAVESAEPEPVVKEPEVKEPETKEPETKEPEVKAPETAKPEMTNSESFVPSETRTWRYCLRDSLDEMFWGFVFLLVMILYWFDFPVSPETGKIASLVLTVIFGIGILYYSYLFPPFKLFDRKKDGIPDPNANSLWYDLATFLFFGVSVLVLIARLFEAVSPGGMPPAFDRFWKVIFILFSIFVLGNALYLLVQIFLARICTYYRLTPVIFIMKTGFFITKERRIAVWDIAQVNMARNLWQRILGVGTIELKVHSHGMDGAGSTPEDLLRNARILHLKGLSDPLEVMETINHYRLFVRNHMGERFKNQITSDSQKGANNE